MFCKKCGKEIADTASFCSGCGAVIENAIAKKPEKIKKEIQPINEKKAKAFMIFLQLFFVCSAALCAAFVLLSILEFIG